MSPSSNPPASVWIPKDDWFRHPLPVNCRFGENVFIDTAYGFAPFRSMQQPGLVMEEGSGAYDRTTFAVGPAGRVDVGAYTCLNGAYLVCEERITIGAHCLIAWGVVLSDHWPTQATPRSVRRASLVAAATHSQRPLPHCGPTRPIILEDNVWVGFGAVVLPGVTLGRGCVVGCRSVVGGDVEPYTVVAGDPPRVLRHLHPDDADPDQRARVIMEHRRKV